MRLLPLTAGAAAVLAAAACSSSGHGAARPGQGATDAAWSRTDLMPVTQPVAIGDTVAVMVQVGGDVDVIALDARTGTTRWVDSASTSAIVPGASFGFVVAGGHLVYFRGKGGVKAQIVSADPATGALQWQTAAGTFTSPAALCPGAPTTLCLTGTLDSGGTPGTVLRISATDGSLLPGATLSTSDSGSAVGSGLYDDGGRSPEKLVATDGATVAWSKAVGDLFPAAGTTADDGWNIDRYPKAGVFVGWLGTPGKDDGSTYTRDLSQTMTVGFKLGDGSPVWRSAGTLYACSALPCPGVDQRLSEIDTTAAAEPTVGVRERLSGTASGSDTSSADPTVSADADVKLEGFAPATGKTLWSFDAGHDKGLLEDGLAFVQSGENSLVLTKGTGNTAVKVSLDLATGHTSPPPATAWCRNQRTFRQDGSSYPYYGEPSVRPCTVDGTVAPAPAKAPAWLGQIGATAGGHVVWSDTDAVKGLPVQKQGS